MTNTLSKLKVLVADDNTDFCKILKSHFEREDDFEIVDVCSNGREALEMIAQKDFNLVVLDLVMPYMDGIGVLENMEKLIEIRGEACKPKIVVLSAIGQESITQKAEQLGADYYFLKPVDLHLLTDRIRDIAQREVTVAEKWERVPYSTRQSWSWEVEITKVLHFIGVPAHVSGYHFLREGIMLVSADMNYLGAVTKELYPAIAAKYDTSPIRVERAIRSAIALTWQYGNMENIHKIFGQAININGHKPGNSKFIAIIADYVRLERAGRTDHVI